MSLPESLRPALAAALRTQTDPELVAAIAGGNHTFIAGWCNVLATPAYYVKRKSLSRHEILTGTSDNGTTFAWAAGAYITRSQGERDAFREMFNDTGTVDPWLPAITAGFADIFSGAGGAGNRAHILAMARRAATRAEKMLTSGAGTKAAPSVTVFDGEIDTTDVGRSLNEF